MRYQFSPRNRRVAAWIWVGILGGMLFYLIFAALLLLYRCGGFRCS